MSRPGRTKRAGIYMDKPVDPPADWGSIDRRRIEIKRATRTAERWMKEGFPSDTKSHHMQGKIYKYS